MTAVTQTTPEQYVAQFEAVNAQMIATVERCSDEQLRQPTGSEGWPVAVVAHHIGEVNGAFARIIARLAAGQTYTPAFSAEAIDDNNARHAHEHADVGRQETLDLLRANGAAIVEQMRDLDDELLARTAGVFGGHELSVRQVIEWVVIGHAAEHLASMRATLAG